MIPTDRQDVLEASLGILQELGTRVGVRGRFVSLYLGLRRMRKEGRLLAELGSSVFTPTGDIEQFLDNLYTKTHRAEPFVVLTAPFGGSTSAEAPYSARSGTRAPGRQYPVNTWRNNFGIQKGIGCPAAPDIIQRLLDDPQRRLACPHMAVDPEEQHVCTIRDTAYRGEEHSIWLRLSDSGYQVVDLDHPAVFSDYLLPRGEYPLPIFPVIAMLYCMAPPELRLQNRTTGIPEFATDFGFELHQVETLFDCDPDSTANAALALRIEDARFPILRRTDTLRPDEVREDIPEVPPDAALNTGVGAEILVARDLQSWGWSVRYRANQVGLGYDLEATKDGVTLRVEVKSSVAFTQLELRDSEWKAAQRYQDEYVLAVVDFYESSEEKTWYVRNPAANAIPTQRATVMYRFVRADIERLATEVEFL